MAGPAITYSTAGQDPGGNALYNAALNAGTTSSRFSLDLSSGGMFAADVAIEAVPGTAAATNGVRLDVYAKVDATNYADAVTYTYSLTGLVTSTTKRALAFRLPPGLYQATVTNLDGTNNLTGVKITASKLS